MDRRVAIVLLLTAGFTAHASIATRAARTSSSHDQLPAAPASADAAELLQLDQRIGTAVVKGDVAYVDSMVPDDFTMVHGDGWTTGGEPLLTDTKASFMKRVASQSYAVIDFDSIKVEMHGDIGITYGHYVANTKVGAPEKIWFSVWFERVYAKRNGRWIYLSHRTVHGPTYGPTRESLRGK